MPMPIAVKICGITTLEDARFAAAAGADMLGFIQHPDSQRHVDTRHARDIIEWICGPKCVGVFVDRSCATVNELTDKAGFNYVQLHGSESPGYCMQIARPIIKTFRVRSNTRAEELRNRMAPYKALVRYFLLDTHHSVLRGGTGRTFDWTVAAQLAAEFPIIAAGGIGPENVLAAIKAAQPAGIDCSSRLEYRPGRKDFDRVARLIEQVRSREQ